MQYRYIGLIIKNTESAVHGLAVCEYRIRIDIPVYKVTPLLLPVNCSGPLCVKRRFLLPAATFGYIIVAQTSSTACNLRHSQTFVKAIRRQLLSEILVTKMV